MKIVCAWCRKVMKKGDNTKVSHGICKSCVAELTKGRHRVYTDSKE